MAKGMLICKASDHLIAGNLTKGIAMRFLSLIAVTISLSACVSTMPSSDALMNSPAATESLDSTRTFDDAYRLSLDRMMICYDAGIIRVYGDKRKDSAVISMKVNDGIAASIKLTPTDAGTHINIYSAGTSPPALVKMQLNCWLNQNSTSCQSITSKTCD
jgi:hypothetical protein